MLAEKEDLARAYEYAREGKMAAFKHLHQSGRCITLLKGLSGRIRNYSVFGVSEIELRGLGNSGPLPDYGQRQLPPCPQIVDSLNRG